MGKNPPAMYKTRVRYLGWEDPLEEGMATHSGILTWRSPWTEEPGGLQSTGLQRVGHNYATNIHTHTHSYCVSNDWISKRGIFRSFISLRTYWGPDLDRCHRVEGGGVESGCRDWGYPPDTWTSVPRCLSRHLGLRSQTLRADIWLLLPGNFRQPCWARLDYGKTEIVPY